MLTIFEELVSVAICSRSNLRSTGLSVCSLLTNLAIIGLGCVEVEWSTF